MEGTIMKVAKFGGTSLADASQIRKVLSIIQSDSERRIIVVSAPGKRNASDQKITDLLYAWHHLAHQGLPVTDIQRAFESRFTDIATTLAVPIDIASICNIIASTATQHVEADYMASRGEFLLGKIIAQALGYHFIDPEVLFTLNRAGIYQEDYAHIQSVIGNRNVVIPGFYGALTNGEIKTFPRGGSDISGAILAAALHADMYENWTDTSGVLVTDPRIFPTAHTIPSLTYRELRELSYMGANVFHEDAIFPVWSAGIVTNIRNTNIPANAGTLVVPKHDHPARQNQKPHAITGIAGHDQFTVITARRLGSHVQSDFVYNFLTALHVHAVNFEHLQSNIGAISVIVNNEALKGKKEELIESITATCKPDSVEEHATMAMITIVGEAMITAYDTEAILFTALAQAHITPWMIAKRASRASISICVEKQHYADAIRVIAQAFQQQ